MEGLLIFIVCACLRVAGVANRTWIICPEIPGFDFKYQGIESRPVGGVFDFFC
jgi:hypothetical protein